MKKAILFGASGFIGSNLLQDLLDSKDYERVTIIVRKNQGIKHPKLHTLIGDLETLAQLKEYMNGDEIFICLGTTKKHTPDQKKYYQIDHDYPVLAAKTALDKGVKSVFVVSAIGANPDSSIFYTRTKGELERDIIALNFEHTHIFEPSMITGNRQEHRAGEKIFISIFKFFSPVLIGNLNKYKGIEAAAVAKAMVNSAKHQSQKVTFYHWSEMMALQHA